MRKDRSVVHFQIRIGEYQLYRQNWFVGDGSLREVVTREVVIQEVVI